LHYSIQNSETFDILYTFLQLN